MRRVRGAGPAWGRHWEEAASNPRGQAAGAPSGVCGGQQSWGMGVAWASGPYPSLGNSSCPVA